jgi:uncharacterized membrane protein
MKRNYFLVAALIIAATLIITLLLYNDLPPRIPMHWNWRGQVDRFGGKQEIFILPAAMIAMALLFAALPWLSPRKFDVGPFRSTYLYIMVLVIALFAYIQAVKLWVSFYSSIDMGRALFGGIFFLFILLGNVLGRVRRNFYIGVRTPWTLASEKVWDATHRFSGRVMVLAGLLGLLSLVVFKGGVAGLVIICGAALASILYSLVCYKRLERRNQL